MTKNTIVAVASGQGLAGVSIIRLSGPQTRDVMSALAGKLPTPRYASLVTLRDGKGDTLDKGLALWFPAPASFTGEDVGEFHVHGGQAVVRDVLDACLAVDGVRLALPGEFSRRAFDNGKMDLSAAEGLADLIEAQTGAQRRQALRQMEGALAQQVVSWRNHIIDALADAEGDIDFPDEDLPPGLSQRARLRLTELAHSLRTHIVESQRAQRIREGFRVAIIGAPNAGKWDPLESTCRHASLSIL